MRSGRRVLRDQKGDWSGGWPPQERAHATRLGRVARAARVAVRS
jgi:hypothetical protein